MCSPTAMRPSRLPLNGSPTCESTGQADRKAPSLRTPVHLIPHRMIQAWRDAKKNDQRFCWSRAVRWAWEDLNLRPHPYQQSRAHRYATLRFCWSLPTVEGEVMRCCNRPGSTCGRVSWPQARYASNRSPARRWAPGGRGPIECDRDRCRVAGPTPGRAVGAPGGQHG